MQIVVGDLFRVTLVACGYTVTPAEVFGLRNAVIGPSVSVEDRPHAVHILHLFVCRILPVIFHQCIYELLVLLCGKLFVFLSRVEQIDFVEYTEKITVLHTLQLQTIDQRIKARKRYLFVRTVYETPSHGFETLLAR